MAKAAAISFKEFRVRYSTEDACREELFRLRFPDGFVCPVCGCQEYIIPPMAVIPSSATPAVIRPPSLPVALCTVPNHP